MDFELPDDTFGGALTASRGMRLPGDGPRDPEMYADRMDGIDGVDGVDRVDDMDIVVSLVA